jgi:hypothetical protein
MEIVLEINKGKSNRELIPEPPGKGKALRPPAHELSFMLFIFFGTGVIF